MVCEEDADTDLRQGMRTWRDQRATYLHNSRIDRMNRGAVRAVNTTAENSQSVVHVHGPCEESQSDDLLAVHFGCSGRIARDKVGETPSMAPSRRRGGGAKSKPPK